MVADICAKCRMAWPAPDSSLCESCRDEGKSTLKGASTDFMVTDRERIDCKTCRATGMIWLHLYGKSQKKPVACSDCNGKGVIVL